MFGIGGWKQVGATFDMKRQAAIREQLEQAGIEYQVKMQNRLKSGVLPAISGRGWEVREKMRHRNGNICFMCRKQRRKRRAV